MIRDDYILRQIKQLSDAIARIAGLARQEQHDAVRAEVERAWDELGVPSDLIDHLDGRSLAQMFRDPELLRVASELLAITRRAR